MAEKKNWNFASKLNNPAKRKSNMNKLSTFKCLFLTFIGENPEDQEKIISKLTELTVITVTIKTESNLSIEILCYGESEFKSLSDLALKLSKDFNMNVLCENIPL